VTITIAESSPVASSGATSPVASDPLQISPATLTFTSDNWNQPQTVTVAPPTTGSGDEFDILTQTVTSDDLNYNNQPLPNINVKLTDPAVVQPGIVVSTQSLQVTMGGPSVTYTLALATQPAADVSVAINQFSPVLDPIIGFSRSDFGPGPRLNITPQTFTFTPDDWNQPVTITVSAPVGQVAPFGRLVVLSDTVTSDDPNYNYISAPTVDVQVQNNVAYGLVFSTNHLLLAPGASGTYTIALAGQPADNVTVAISQQSGSPVALMQAISAAGLPSIDVGSSTVTISPTTLTFTPDNWNTPQTVTVTAAASTNSTNVFGLDQLVSTVTSNDPNWNNINSLPVIVFVSNLSLPPVVGPITITPPPGLGIGPITITVPPLPTQTALSIGSAVGSFDQMVTLTAKVTAKGNSSVVPTGTVTFMNGSTVLGTGTLSNGVASLQTALLDVGKNSLTAEYASDTGKESTSTSAAHTATISKARTHVTLTASASPATYGETVTLTATLSVVGNNTVTPGGTVTFMDRSTILGTSTPSQGVATLRTSGLGVGTHDLKAEYAGDAGTAASSGSMSETVKKATTATTLNAGTAASTVAAGTALTLTATVTGTSTGAPTPTGSVTFKMGSTVLGTGTLHGGVATLHTGKLAKGKHVLTVVYGGERRQRQEHIGDVDYHDRLTTDLLSSPPRGEGRRCLRVQSW
jgi:hypothetical protein